MSESSPRAVAGWSRHHGEHGIMLRMQLVDSVAGHRRREFEKVDLVLNDRQLRSLARDLARAAEARGLDLRAKRRWWRLW